MHKILSAFKYEKITKQNPSRYRVKKVATANSFFSNTPCNFFLEITYLATTQQIPMAKVVKGARIIASIVISFPQMIGELIIQLFLSCALTHFKFSLGL
jgi:hypothetical protein